MPQPTFDELFNDEQSVVTSAVYDGSTDTLTIVFSETVTAAQAWLSVLQSGQRWLKNNTDLEVNLSANPVNQFTANRNGVSKLQTTFSISAYTPNTNEVVDPLGV